MGGKALGSWAARVFPGPLAAVHAHPVSGSAEDATAPPAMPDLALAPDLLRASAPVGAPEAHERAAGDTEWSRQFVRCAPPPGCMAALCLRPGHLRLLACTCLDTLIKMHAGRCDGHESTHHGSHPLTFDFGCMCQERSV